MSPPGNAWIVQDHEHEPVGIGVGQRAQEHTVGDGENAGSEAGADSQRQDAGDEEHGRTP